MQIEKLPLLAASAVACAAFSLATANAAVIAEWNFATDPGNNKHAATAYLTAQSTETTAVNQTVTPWTPPTGITVSTLTLGPGATFSLGGGGALEGGQAYNFSSGTSSGILADVAKGSYEQFTVTIDAGHSLNLTNASIATGNSSIYTYDGSSYFSSSKTGGNTTSLGSGANGYVWRGYELYSHALFPYTVDLTPANSAAGLSLQNLTNTSVTFYVPIDYNSGGVPAGILNLTLNGTLSTVPEPATFAMVLGGFGALALLRRRRRD